MKIANSGLDTDMIIGKDYWYNPKTGKDFSTILPLKLEMFTFFKGSLPHQSTFFKRVLFKEEKYDETLKVVSDWKFWLDAILKGNASVDVIPVIVARQDMTGLSSNLAAQEQEKQVVLDAYFPKLLQQELENYQKVRESVFYIYGEKLRQKSHALYAIGWRLLRLLSKI